MAFDKHTRMIIEALEMLLDDERVANLIKNGELTREGVVDVFVNELNSAMVREVDSRMLNGEISNEEIVGLL